MKTEQEIEEEKRAAERREVAKLRKRKYRAQKRMAATATTEQADSVIPDDYDVDLSDKQLEALLVIREQDVKARKETRVSDLFCSFVCLSV